MVLAPLLARLMEQRPIPSAKPIAVGIEASIVDDRLQLRLSCRGANLRMTPDNPVVAELRARLQALYGAAATLTVDAVYGNRAFAVLVLPRESVRSTAEDRLVDGKFGSEPFRFDPAYQGA